MLNKLSVAYNNRSISLESVSTLAILGDNGVGKTSLLERIALVNKSNLDIILNYKGAVYYEKFKVTIDNQEVECSQIKAERLYNLVVSEYSYSCLGNLKYNVMIVYPSALTVHIHPSDHDIKFSEFVKPFIDGIIIHTANDFIYEKNNTITFLDNLGKGVSSLVKLLHMIYINRPDILLIDDIETLGLHPKRLTSFFEWIKQRIQEGYLKAMLFTTNSDSYTYLAEVDESSKFLLLSQEDYMIMNRQEVLDRLDYEDLRYTALKLVKKDES